MHFDGSGARGPAARTAWATKARPALAAPAAAHTAAAALVRSARPLAALPTLLVGWSTFTAVAGGESKRSKKGKRDESSACPKLAGYLHDISAYA
jgi:hypothetical protein